MNLKDLVKLRLPLTNPCAAKSRSLPANLEPSPLQLAAQLVQSEDGDRSRLISPDQIGGEETRGGPVQRHTCDCAVVVVVYLRTRDSFGFGGRASSTVGTPDIVLLGGGGPTYQATSQSALSSTVETKPYLPGRVSFVHSTNTATVTRVYIHGTWDGSLSDLPAPTDRTGCSCLSAIGSPRRQSDHL